MTDNKEIPQEVIQHYKQIATGFYFWWHNQKGTNTYQGFDAFIKTDVAQELFSNGHLLSQQALAEKEKRIRELEAQIEKAKWLLNPFFNDDRYEHAKHVERDQFTKPNHP
jgi:hypothetical protein